MITSLHHFFQGLKEQSETHCISLVRTRTGVCTKNDNENIWLASHYTHRKIYLLWLENSLWIAQSDANGSYGPTKEYHRISRDIETSPICAWSTFVVFWKSNYSKIKIRRPYMDTCGICFINTMAINTIEHKRKLSRNRMMCMENEFWTDISDISVEINNNLNVTNNGGATVPNHVNIQPIHMDDEVNNESIRFNQEFIDTIHNFDECDPSYTFTCSYQKK